MATAPVSRKNPYAAFNFVVEISGPPPSSPSGGGTGASAASTSSSGSNSTTIGAFMEASGLDGENAIIEYREGADQSSTNNSSGGTQTGAFVRKLPGLERYPNVVLRRGICGDTTLWTMRKNVRDAANGPEFWDGKSAQPTLTISLQNEVHQPVLSWALHNVWVSKLSGPSLNAKANEIAVESVEFVCERIEIFTNDNASQS